MAKLPYSINTIRDMNSYLEQKLEHCSCDHLLYFTMEFIELHQLSIKPLLRWLKAVNIDCDCKIQVYIKRYADSQFSVVK
jgi:predicted aldo/keto reductase-like oxidoreductase